MTRRTRTPLLSEVSKILGRMSLCGALLIMAVFTANLHGAAPEQDLSHEQISVILKSENWSAIHLLAVYQSSVHPTEAKWRDLANYAASQLPDPRVQQSPVNLSAPDKTRLTNLSKRVGTWTTLPPGEQKAESQSLFPEVKKLAADFPDLPAAWILEAQMAILANRPLEGRIAARNLEELSAWETRSESVLALLAQLQTLDWMPALNANQEQRLQLSKLSQQVQALGGQPNPLEKLPAILSQVKTFCSQNEKLPNGWLLQYHLATRLSRSLDQGLAKRRLAQLHASNR